MRHVVGDLLETKDMDVMIHCCNLYHTFGSGLALSIKNKYPEAYTADKITERGAEYRLGTFTKTSVDNFTIYNLYAMKGLGNSGHPLGRNLSYDHFYDGIFRICEDAEKSFDKDRIEIGIPMNFGCCRAGGEWNVVESILWNIESRFPHIEFVVHELEEAENDAESTISWEL